jgi:signal transduction histidine kinase
MRLSTRILLPSFLLLAAALAGGVALLDYQRKQEAALRADAALVERAAALASNLGSDNAAIQFNLLAYRIDRRQARLDDIARLDRDMARAIDAYALLAGEAGERALLKAFIDRRNEILHLRIGLVRAVQSGEAAPIQAAFDIWALQRLQVNAALEDLIGYRLRIFGEAVRAAAARSTDFMRLTGLGIVAAFLGVLAYAAWVAKGVARPLADVLDGIERLGGDTLEARLDARLERPRDEIGGLARAFNAMAGRLDASHRQLTAEMVRRNAAQEALRQANSLLELRVQQRTEALAQANRTLQEEVAERERAAAALRRRNEELAQFNHIASHDLQEPLRMVTGYVQLLARRYRGRLDAEADTFIGYAVEGAERMQSLIRDVLAYSLVDNSGRELRPVDANRALQAAQDDLESRLALYGGSLAHDPLPTVTADEAQLTQVFAALIDNALKFSGAEALRITVSASRTGDLWEFVVADNGIGIAPEYHERIFRIFQRLHPRERHPGNGLGLALCKRIVERFGGDIRVTSAPGEGATFRFTVPAV